MSESISATASKSTSPKTTIEIPLTGWGRYPVVTSQVQRPEKVSALHHLVQHEQTDNILARGAGRSYGDAALNATGETLLTERLNRMLDFDEETGILRCEPGVTMREVLEVFVPRGWFPIVTPGTKFPTIGGCVAFDVHGKSHHQDGAFGRHVRKLKMVLASGEVVECSKEQNSDLFWATVGGMGLTGIITEVEFALRRIETAYIKAHNIKADNLDEAIALFEKYGEEYAHSVAWIDCLASGKSLGRSIVMFGNHADVNDLPPSQRANPLQIKPKGRLKVTFDPPSGLLNRLTMSLFNTLYFGKQLAKETRAITDYDTFFYPLDFLWDWNRLYGKQGFVQYQCALPLETSREGLTEMLTLSSKKGWASFLAVLKRLGPHEGWLSFPIEGYTLALDIPVKPGIWEFLDQLDALVLKYGGRVYLAKDARLSAQAFRQMYPEYPQWLAVKSRVDPHNRFTSALAQRLEIVPNCG